MRKRLFAIPFRSSDFSFDNDTLRTQEDAEKLFFSAISLECLIQLAPEQLSIDIELEIHFSQRYFMDGLPRILVASRSHGSPYNKIKPSQHPNEIENIIITI